VVVPAAVEAVVDVVGADATEAAEAVVAIVVADAADLVVAAGVATKRSSHKLQRPRQKSRPFSFYFFVLIKPTNVSSRTRARNAQERGTLRNL
jgi:hypothetical protein